MEAQLRHLARVRDLAIREGAHVTGFERGDADCVSGEREELDLEGLGPLVNVYDRAQVARVSPTPAVTSERPYRAL